jgi:hypothetical protein
MENLTSKLNNQDFSFSIKEIESLEKEINEIR